MRLLVCGDYIVYGDRLPNQLKTLECFKDIINDTDYAIYNQEFPITRSKDYYSTKRYGLRAKTDPIMLKPILLAGFNVATLANNHIFNYGMSGLRDTIDELTNNGISYVGAGSTLDEARRILYLEKNGIKCAVLNYAEHEYNVASINHGGANPIDIISVLRSVSEARKTSDAVIIILHGGIDFSRLPAPRVVHMCRYFAEQGASAIFIHHSHVVSGFELHNGVPIFYGLGNLVPGKIVTFNCLYSYSVMLEIEPESKSVFFTGYHAKWDQDESRVVLLTGDELLIAEQEQQRLNRIIGSEDQNAIAEALHMEFLTRERESSYFTALTRSSQLMFRIAKKARMINAYHRFIVRRMRLNRRNSTLWNMLRCETHRDVFDLIYNKHIDTYKNQ